MFVRCIACQQYGVVTMGVSLEAACDLGQRVGGRAEAAARPCQLPGCHHMSARHCRARPPKPIQLPGLNVAWC